MPGRARSSQSCRPRKHMASTSPPCQARRAAPALSCHHPRRVTKGPRSQRPSSETERALVGDLVGGAEGTRTPDPLVANSGHGGRPAFSEHGYGRSKAREPGGSRGRCCTELLYLCSCDRRRLPLSCCRNGWDRAGRSRNGRNRAGRSRNGRNRAGRSRNGRNRAGFCHGATVSASPVRGAQLAVGPPWNCETSQRVPESCPAH
jgi:hypothetical protein